MKIFLTFIACSLYAFANTEHANDTLLTGNSQQYHILMTQSDSQYATIQTEYSRIITLGSWCQTKGQINNYFSPNTPITQTKKGHADLFDWLFISDYSKLADALHKNLEDFFEFEDFKWKIKPYASNINIKYHVHWNHLWSDHNAFEMPLSLGEIEEIFPQIKLKIDYLRQKFIDAKQYPTLYVVSHSESGPSKTDIEKLRNSITQIRDGKTDFSILFISKNPTFESFDNIYVRQSTPISCCWTQADSVRWKQILDEFKFSPTIWD